MSKLRVLDIHGGTVLVDDADAGSLGEFRWYRMNNGYAGAMIGSGPDRKCILMHRLLCGEPTGMCVDHINGDKLDNRRVNLRVVDQHVNQINRKSRNRNNTSGERGVTWKAQRKKWIAQITIYGRNHHLGTFESFDDALSARKAAESAMWPEVAP